MPPPPPPKRTRGKLTITFALDSPIDVQLEKARRKAMRAAGVDVREP